MKIKVLTGQVAAELRQLAAIVGLFLSVGNSAHLPSNIRAILLTVSGVILSAEHIVNGLAGNSANVGVETAPASTGQVQAGAVSA